MMSEFKKYMIRRSNKDSGHSRSSGQRVSRAYIIALGIIAALSVAAFVALDGFISKQGNAASIIGVAGKQLVLSQRIVSFSQSLIRREVSDGSNRPAVERDLYFLQTSVEEMEKAHASLTLGDPSRNLPGIASETERALYENAPIHINQRLKYFLSDARQVIKDPASPKAAAAAERILRESETSLTRSLNAVVNHHEELARQHANRAAMLHLVILVATLLVLVAEGVFIFRPLARSLVKTEQDLDAKCDELAFQSLHDPLTGVMNRRGLKRVLETSRNAGNLDRAAVLMMDLDNFKIINDTYGHDAGDELLRLTADTLNSVLSESDQCFRMGGDEFLIIASPPATKDRTGSGVGRFAIDLAERLTAAMAEGRSGDLRSDAPSVSIGIACAPDHGSDFDTLLTNADLALYRAKSRGRDRMVCYEPSFRNHYEYQQQQEAILRRALARDAFEPFFQPQIDMRSGEVIGVETLARYRDEHGELVAPASFLDIAEQSKLIIPIGRAVIEKAVRSAALWLAHGIEFGQISINASAAQLGDPNFVNHIDMVLKRYDFPATRLAVEVLETVLLDERNQNVIEVCKEIRALGASIELDDFGVGYASIANVDSLGVDRIKIDRSLLNRPADSKSRDILGAMIGVARSLQLDVLAEGVETPEHEARLMVLGCHKVQGYRFAKPMSADDVLIWFEHHYAEQKADLDTKALTG